MIYIYIAVDMCYVSICTYIAYNHIIDMNKLQNGMYTPLLQHLDTWPWNMCLSYGRFTM